MVEPLGPTMFHNIAHWQWAWAAGAAAAATLIPDDNNFLQQSYMLS